jgi:hypothetical protein
MTLLVIVALLVLSIAATGEAMPQTKVACEVVSSQKQIPPGVGDSVAKLLCTR